MGLAMALPYLTQLTLAKGFVWVSMIDACL
jgi:hypothetical protein